MPTEKIVSEHQVKMKKAVEGNLLVTATSDFGKVVLDVAKDVKVRAGGNKQIPLEMGRLAPGFYNVSVVLESETGNKRVEFAIGVRPEDIISPLDRAEDFDNYWIRARKELDAVDPQFKLIRQNKLCTETREVFRPAPIMVASCTPLNCSWARFIRMAAPLA